MEILKGGLNVSDEILGNFAPIIVCWLYSGMYVMLGSLESYSLHTRKDEDEKILVPKTDVVKGVLLQQAVQAVVATMLFAVTKSDNSAQPQPTSLIVLARHFFVAMMILDTWQYFMHHNKFLYTHPLSTSPACCSIRLWSFIQPPLGGSYSRHSWWSFIFLCLRNVASNFHLLLLIRYPQNH